MRRYERASTLLTSNRPVDDWGKLLGDTAAVTALLDRLLHHAHVLKAARAAGGCATMPCPRRALRSKSDHDIRAVAIGRV
ncbi:MAG: ATP-binding protein [Candidatus Binatia bacterium]